LKIDKGITIPKLWKDDYGKAKSYRVISLLNCISKTVEKVAAILITEAVEKGKSYLHMGQFGRRKVRGVLKQQHVLIVEVEEAWKQKKIV
jgi:hypothetical protein